MGRWEPNAQARLQEAALALYGERGYDQTTVAEIAERAGLTKRTFFRYFADKREVLFWGSELLEQQMVAAIKDAPAPASAALPGSAPAPAPGEGPVDASAFGLIGAALDAAAVRFEEVREFAGLRHRIVSSSPELQERELIKRASLIAAMAEALRARGVDGTAAELAAHTGAAVMHIAFLKWVEDPARTPFREIAREALAELRTLAAE
jgi:AcrR family transcriptional regulator